MPNIPNNLNTLVHIGAGQGLELEDYLKSDAKSILLIEPHPVLAEELRQRTKNESRVRIIEAAVSGDIDKNLLFEFNLPEATSLYKPDGLYQLFPGLRLVAQHAVKTHTPAELLKEWLPADKENLLIIQAPGSEESIVNALIAENLLERAKHLTFTSSNQPYYDSVSSAPGVLQTLKRHGFELAGEDQSNIDWPQWHMVFDARVQTTKRIMRDNEKKNYEIQSLNESLKKEKAQVESLASQIAAKDSSLDKERKENATLKKEVTELQEQESKLTDKINQLSNELKQRSEELHQKQSEVQSLSEALGELQGKVNNLNEQLQEREKTIEQQKNQLQSAQEYQKTAEQKTADLTNKVQSLEQQLAAQKATQQNTDKLLQRMEYLFEQQSLQLEQAANALGRHVSTTAKTTARELEAGIQLQQQYGSQLMGLEEQGKRLPATVALQLSRQLKSQPYDVIIEMGSGVTTSFLAHTLRNQPHNPNGKEPNNREVAHYIDPSDEDLPKRIVCFEHNRTKFNSLQSTLKQTGLAPVINLHFSPLVPYQHQGREYLYYDCNNRLQQLANLFENREAKIFVLLNHAMGDQQPERFAALPQLLQHLSAHSIDIVVNDLNGSADIMAQWQSLLESRGLEYQPAAEFGAASAQLLKINP